jgi:AcrR family transcriptional regulator
VCVVKNEYSFYRPGMPRVTDEHREARREQIVQAALRSVAKGGFHKTTMADVIRESGLSAGAVYGYFRSKDEILRAIAERSIGRLEGVFDTMLAGGAVPHPADVLEAALDRLLQFAVQDDYDATVIIVQAWGEAVRGGEIRNMIAPQITAVREHFTEVVRRYRDAGHLDPSTDPAEVARTLLGLLPGFILQRLLLGEITPESYASGLRTLVDSCPKPGQGDPLS